MLARLLVAASWLISIIQWALVVRAIVSWFPTFPPSQAIYQALCVLTDPIVAPIRAGLRKVPQLSQLPIDLSVLFAYFALELVRILLL
ncbi:MAG TPA: YggT family protein [Candidatus Acidoferrum sp.]|nr:YggT family protein [Candidatus Acidoferrum sp.]